MARWIVSQLDPQPDDVIVEVGPGTGALSEHLAGQVKKLILVEFDSRLAAYLRDRFEGNDSVEVHEADAVKFDPRVLWKHGRLKFLGNLPYSCGGAILRNFLSRPNPFTRGVIMLQKEVIERLGAVPRTKDYGILTLRVQSEWRVNSLRTVPPDSFYPRPRIDSAVAVLEPRGTELKAFDARKFDELVRRGFAQRRKQMGRQMPETLVWEDVADQLGISRLTRAEELSLEQWVELARTYDEHPLRDVPQKDGEIFDVVDENDEVVRQATRKEAHTQGLIHRAVHVFVINRRGELLLQKRSRFKDAHPGVWDSSASGHLDAGEDYEHAAIREVEEEMGVADVALTRVAHLPPSEATGWEHIELFSARWDGTPRFPCAEVEATVWMKPDEIDAWTTDHPECFASGFIECWKAARGR